MQADSSPAGVPRGMIGSVCLKSPERTTLTPPITELDLRMSLSMRSTVVEIIGQLAVRYRVRRAWAYRVYKEVIDLEFILGVIACVFDIFRQCVKEVK